MLEIFLYFQKKQYCTLQALVLQSQWESRLPRLQDSLCFITRHRAPFCDAWGSGTTETDGQAGEIRTIFWEGVSESQQPVSGDLGTNSACRNPPLEWVPPNYSARRDLPSHESTNTHISSSSKTSVIHFSTHLRRQIWIEWNFKVHKELFNLETKALLNLSLNWTWIMKKTIA